MPLLTVQLGNDTDPERDFYDPGLPLPYPFHVRAETGVVTRQAVWKGSPFEVVGFQRETDVFRVDLAWSDAARDPQAAVGMHLVTMDERGAFATHPMPVIRITEAPAPGSEE